MPTTRRRRRAPKATHPTADLGRHIRNLRKAAGYTHDTLSDKIKIRAPQLSVIETGHNVFSYQYAAIAKALGFRGALEMFRSHDSDPKRRQLERAWDVLDDTQKARALRFLNTLLVGD